MPPKTKKPKAPRKKGLKQKQKQMVQTSVKVNVQSAGGSGAGGSVPLTSGIPNAFNEARLATLIEQIGRRVPVQQPVYVPSGMPIQEQVPAVPFQPANDEATLKAVFMGESDLRKPLTNTGPVEKKARKPREKIPISNKIKEKEAGYMSFPSSEEYSPIGYEAVSQVMGPYSKVIPKYRRNPYASESEPSLVQQAMAPKKEEPQFSGFSIVSSGGFERI